jgi:hypothetical protein
MCQRLAALAPQKRRRLRPCGLRDNLLTNGWLNFGGCESTRIHARCRPVDLSRNLVDEAIEGLVVENVAEQSSSTPGAAVIRKANITFDARQ